MLSILGETDVVFQIEMEESPSRLILVLDRKCMVFILPWQSAFHLAEVMEQAARENIKHFGPRNLCTTEREQAQIKLTHEVGCVSFLIDWTDRIAFTELSAWLLLIRAIRLQAQNAQFKARGIVLPVLPGRR